MSYALLQGQMVCEIVGVKEYGLVWGTLIPQLEQVEVDAESSLAPSAAYVSGRRRNPYSRSSQQSIVIDESYHIVLHIKLPCSLQ
jgi:hypothetical protein